jgi:membrane peptidoglycan carboxypeptidase
MLLVLLGLFLLGTTLAVAAYAMVSVPRPNEFANAQASVIYYSDGKTELGREGVVNRESVPLSKIPLHVQHALLAAEDRSFYQNNGVSPTGIGRAVVVALKGGPTQGGSTITQQYVKNYFLTADQTITRKAREFIISIKIDQQESKDTILENYLNTIYYGRGASGIQRASKAYFGKDVSKLTVSQGALLASVIRGPAFYDPRLGADQKANAKARVKYVLDGMVTQGWLTPQQRAETAFPKTIALKVANRKGTAPYIVEEVKNELKSKLKLTQGDIDSGGLRIVTTINKKAQAAAVKAVAENAPSDPKECGLYRNAPKPGTKGTGPKRGDKRSGLECRIRTGLTAVRPGDGAIVAMYGGKDYEKAPFNEATQGRMQAGSTFKVFGLLAALQNDISTKKTYNGRSPQFFPEFVSDRDPRGKVENFANEQVGRVTLRNALAHSVNTIFAQVNIELADGGKTSSALKDAAILAGLPKNTPGMGNNLAQIFGTASPHVLDMANAYATIAAQGRRATPYLISRVTTADGHIDYRVKKRVVKAFDKDVTADATEAMTHVLTEGTAALNSGGLGRPAAGKTGTTTDNLAAWFDGFTPQLSAAVGMHQGSGQEPIELNSGVEVTGAGFPVKIWTAFMKGALDGEKALAFPPRTGIGDSKLPPPPPPKPSFTPAPVPAPAPAPTNAPEPRRQAPPSADPVPVPEPVPPTFTDPAPQPGPNPRPTRTRKPGRGGGQPGPPPVPAPGVPAAPLLQP